MFACTRTGRKLENRPSASVTPPGTGNDTTRPPTDSWFTRFPMSSPLIVEMSTQERLKPMFSWPLPMVSARSPMIGPSTCVRRSNDSRAGL